MYTTFVAKKQQEGGNMSNKTHCALCNAKECLSTLGQFTLCASCRLELLDTALEFAEHNTVRTSALHAAFKALGAKLKETPENFI